MTRLVHFVEARMAIYLYNLDNCGRSFHGALETRYIDAIDEARSDLESELGDVESSIDVLTIAFGAIICGAGHIEHALQLRLDCWNSLYAGGTLAGVRSGNWNGNGEIGERRAGTGIGIREKTSPPAACGRGSANGPMIPRMRDDLGAKDG